MIDEKTAQFIEAHKTDDVRDLMLKYGNRQDIDARTAAVQIRGWQIARKKLPEWAETEGIIYPEHISMEQCSSEQTSHYKAVLAERLCGEERERFADLTGGLGADTAAIGRNFGHTVYVERNEELCRAAENNLPKMGISDIRIVCDDSENVLNKMESQGLLFIDPARRDENGGKTVEICDCTPDVSALNDQIRNKCRFAMIKLSPMLEIKSAEKELKGIKEIHVVSVDGECKETLFVLEGHQTSSSEEPIIVCTNIVRGEIQELSFRRKEEQEAECRYASTLGHYLYEPNASILKGGGLKFAAQKYGVYKLSQNSHLYTSDVPVEDFQGRIFEIIDECAFSPKDMKAMMKGEKKANITVRNFPATVADIRNRCKLKEGGDIYLFATTMTDGRHVIIKCRKMNAKQT